eukprot:CAMPEP_0113535240 /NCGR_PEP_ID=MMETSP0015_2-20120614/5594_1 /TAXON_ID=2838 /ORGANISM="Odontella" /LENGTH=356 /DNA_ID=CAMNT_0000434469 /DNA_START=382 /DNA_END=1453 /DNA_ORIENTATION=- /assembly_acc=CAM_ASM_000160
MKFTAFTIALFASSASAFSVHSSFPVKQRTASSTQLHASLNSKNDDLYAGQTNTALSAATLADVDVVEQLDQAAEVESAAKSYLDDGFIFGLESSGLERPKGKSANVVVEGDSLETQPWQVAAVGTTFAGHAIFAGTAIYQMLALNNGDTVFTAAESLAVIASSWAIADLGSGILHWSVDNYGNGRTPIMGGIIAAFQGHHSAQWTITYREFCNNVYKLCIPFGIPTMAAISLLAGSEHPSVTLFFAVFCAMEILSQEFHKWAHMSKGEVPSYVNWLQDVGLTISRKAHANHHKVPYDGNYCIVSAYAMTTWTAAGSSEHAVYEFNGVESNSWKLDPELRARTLMGDYSLPLKQKR